MGVYITAYDSQKKSLHTEFRTSSFDVNEIVHEFDWKKDGDYASVLGSEPTKKDEKVLIALKDKFFKAKRKKLKEISTELKVLDAASYKSKKDAISDFLDEIEDVITLINLANERIFSGSETEAQEKIETLTEDLNEAVKHVIKFIETFAAEETKEALSGNALNILDHVDSVIALNWAEYVVATAIGANGYLRME